MQRQRMIKMLREAMAAVGEAGLYNQTINHGDQSLCPTDGTQNLIGQLIMASAIEESGSSISLSLDKLEKVAVELGEIAGGFARR